MDYANYDFRDDWNDKENEKERYDEFVNSDPLTKYFIYKMTAANSKPDKVYSNALGLYNKVHEYPCIDPDSYSSLLQDIYKKLWHKDILTLCTDSNGRIHGDTMNSIATTLGKYYRFLYNNDGDYYGGDTEGFKRGYSGSISQALEIFLRENKSHKDSKVSEEALHYFDICYRLGNFMPVPFENNGGQFNVPRYKSTRDYWDLTLLRIYNWYEDNKDCSNEKILETIENECDCNKNKELCLLLGRNCANVKLCIKWLCAFGSWKEFVEKNYMQPFVGKEDVNGNYGAPLELWEGHFKRYEDGIFKNPLPLCKEQCEEFFKNATKRIKERSERMAEKFRSAK